MAGKFEVYKDKAGKFRFRLKAGNGEIIAVGEAYESKASAISGIQSIRANAEAATLVDLTDQAKNVPAGHTTGSGHTVPADQSMPMGKGMPMGRSTGPK
ncbi:uncharacterized protein YegP (UPF0339 family) [Catenulispora sp. MAP12-49]|jgi:uncharacterized protein